MFKTARLKLTAWYLLIIMTISIAFSGTIYGMVCSEVERFEKMQRTRMERKIKEQFSPLPDRPFPGPNLELLQETRSRLLYFLFFVNGMIFVVSGILGYVLAGQTLKPIQVMMDEQNQFITDASHELRTPLTALKSSIEVFLRNKNPGVVETQNTFKDNLTEVNKLQYLSDKMLELLAQNQFNRKDSFQKVSVKKIVEQALAQIEKIAKNKNIIFKTKINNLTVKGSGEKLVSLISIFLDNAVKYSPSNSVVELSVKKENKQALITIKDQGVGISKADLPHIFDRFYRSSVSRSKNNEPGYGLGLAIAKQILTEHQGEVRVESKVNQGSTFNIYLPLA